MAAISSMMEHDITWMEETFKSVKKTRKEEEEEEDKKSSPTSPQTDNNRSSDDDSREKSVSDEEESSPTSGDYDWDGFSENECYAEGAESDEEIIRDSVRNEINHGYRFVVQNGVTITNPRRPQKTYISRSSKHSNSVLHDKQHPLSALAKLALRRYNHIRGTNYKYIGLVKAYKGVVGGFVFWIRFKASLRAQPHIDFQAIVYQGIPDRLKPRRKTRDVDVDIQFVYPLP